MPDTSTVYKVQLFSQHPVLGCLAQSDIERIVGFAKELRFADGNVIFRKGDVGSSMMAVTRGRIRISSTSPDGKEVVLSILGIGDVVGELSLLDGQERSADATAIGECTLLSIERRDFLPFLTQNPSVAINLLSILCHRLRRSNMLVEDIVFLDLQGRLARLLLHLSERYGVQTPSGLSIDLRLSQKDIAGLVGTTRESVNRQLRTWETQKLVTVRRNQITLLCTAALRDLAEADR